MENEIDRRRLEEQMITIALLRGALAKISRLGESEGAEPLDDAIRIARNAILTSS